MSITLDRRSPSCLIRWTAPRSTFSLATTSPATSSAEERIARETSRSFMGGLDDERGPPSIGLRAGNPQFAAGWLGRGPDLQHRVGPAEGVPAAVRVAEGLRALGDLGGLLQ